MKTYNGKTSEDLLNIFVGQPSFPEAIEAVAEACTPKWIPCAERLPKASGEYLCVLEDMDDEASKNEIRIWPYSNIFNKFSRMCRYKAIYWMPLPPAPTQETR